MNKKGITFFYTLMLGMTIVVLGLALASPIKEFADDARTNLSCSAPANMYDEAGCYGIEFIRVMATAGIILIGVAVIAGKGLGWLG